MPVTRTAAVVAIVSPNEHHPSSRLNIRFGEYALCIETSGEYATGKFSSDHGCCEIWRGTDPTAKLMELGLTPLPSADMMAGAAEYYRPGIYNGD